MSALINSSKDLETTYAAKRAGFLEIALRKNKEALPYVDEAKALKAIAVQHCNPRAMVGDDRIQGPLAEAAGISTKASNYLEKEDTNGIVIEFIKNYLEPAGSNFVEELVYRYLLAKGDALGGRMRNIVGAIAGEKLTRFLSANLRNQRYCHEYLINGSSNWILSNSFRQQDLGAVKAIRWYKGDDQREIIYNIAVPIVRKNIDISVFNSFSTRLTTAAKRKEFLSSASNYLALGELQGGIDPAGADEHWKTANTALNRIRTSFKEEGNPVKTIFVGGAIEASMAQEIYAQYKSGELSAVANLTNEAQLSALCAWIINL